LTTLLDTRQETQTLRMRELIRDREIIHICNTSPHCNHLNLLWLTQESELEVIPVPKQRTPLSKFGPSFYGVTVPPAMSPMTLGYYTSYSNEI
jgi:hypothetical protein